jgi:hypothetical protein
MFRNFWTYREKIDAASPPRSCPSGQLIVMGFVPALVMGILVSRLGGVWEAAGTFGVVGVTLLSWFITGAGLAEYQRAAYFRAKRQRLELSTIHGIEGEITRAKRALIAAARAYVEQLTTARCESLDFRKILEAREFSMRFVPTSAKTF